MMRKGQTPVAEKIISGKTNIFSLLRPYSGMVALLVLFALLGNGTNLLIPLIISRAIDGYINGDVIFKKAITEFPGSCILYSGFQLFSGHCTDLYLGESGHGICENK